MDILPDGDAIIKKLSAGFLYAEKARNRDGYLRYPYPDKLQKALNYLTLYRAMNQLPVISNVGKLFELAKKTPINQWGLELSEEYDVEELLLDEHNQLSDLCNEWATEELQDSEYDRFQRKIFETTIALASLTKDKDKFYQQVRTFLVKHPLSTGDERRDFLFDIEAKVEERVQKELLEKVYDPKSWESKIPNTYLVEGQILRCKICGNLVLKFEKSLSCSNQKCQFNREPEYKRIENVEKLDKRLDVLQAHYGVIRFVSIPGIPELELKDKLEKIGCKVQMWPGQDLCDLFVETPSHFKIAVDVKDWKSPKNLAKSVKPIPRDELRDKGFPTNFGCFVFPDFRKKENPAYAGTFKQKCELESVEAFFVTELIELIKEKYMRGDR